MGRAAAAEPSLRGATAAAALPTTVAPAGMMEFPASYDLGGTVYSRVEGLASPSGMFGFAFNALREAIYGEQSDRLLLVRYESLTANPLGTLAAIYGFIGEELHPHDPKHIEPNYDMVEFDQRLGTPGLHDIGRAVEARERKPILPRTSLRATRKTRSGKTSSSSRRR